MFPADRYPVYMETTAVAATTVLAGLLALVAPLFFLSVLLAPLPLVYLIVKRDLGQALLALLVASIFIFLAVGKLVLTMLLLLHIGPPAILMGLLIKNRVSVGKCIAVLWLWVLVAAGINLGYVYLSGAAGLNYATGEINSMVEQMTGHYLETGLLDEPDRQQLVEAAGQVAGMARLFLPGSVVVWVATATLGTFFIARRLLAAVGFKVSEGIPFSRWHLPWYSIWLVITGLALTLAGEQYLQGLPAMIGKNILFVSAFIFFVLGLSVAVYFFQNVRIAKVFKVIIAILVFLYLPFVILALGVVDPVTNLRRLPVDGGEGFKGG